MKKKDLELVLRDPKFPKDFIPQVGQALICSCCRCIVILLEAVMIKIRRRNFIVLSKFLHVFLCAQKYFQYIFYFIFIFSAVFFFMNIYVVL